MLSQNCKIIRPCPSNSFYLSTVLLLHRILKHKNNNNNNNNKKSGGTFGGVVHMLQGASRFRKLLKKSAEGEKNPFGLKLCLYLYFFSMDIH